MELLTEKYSIPEIILSAAIVTVGSYALHHSLKHLLKLWDREDDFPVGANMFHHPFGEPFISPCHLSAEGVFSLLTGITVNNLDPLGYSHKSYVFDNKNSSEKTATFIGLSWKDENIVHRFKKNYSYHALVYCDGYLYQSYRTARHWWSPWTDSYPLIRMKLNKKDSKIFEERETISVSDFNRLCAPSTNLIPEDATVRYQKRNYLNSRT